MPEIVDVWRKSPIRLEPIRERVAQLEKLRQVSRVCAEAQITRNHLYLILRGGTNTTEEKLRPLLKALDLTWEQVAGQ